MYYGPVSYHAPGWVYPRDQLRQPPPLPARGWHSRHDLIAALLADSYTPPHTELAVDVLEAIATVLNANSTLAAAFGRADFCWLEQAPRGTAFPVCVLSGISGAIDWDGAASWDDNREFQVAVYSTDRRQALRLGRQVAIAIETADDAGEIEHEGSITLRIRRSTGERILLDGERGRDGRDVWQWSQDFDAIAQSE